MALMHDEAVIEVRSGNGGSGCVSFRREKYVEEGGPDGGDGGRGGDVVAVVNPHLNTLTAFKRKRVWKARPGQQGRGRNCSGAGGQDCELLMPRGTIIRDAETDEIIADLTGVDERLVIAKGGKGGWGNTRFKKATNQTPRQFGPGEDGVTRHLRLDLKLIADVGIVGFPNAGKSTLLSRITSATPKIGAYPFTTLEPQLGVLHTSGERDVVLADIPGLIEGAAEGVGLGHQFLRHVERCGMLLHLVDGSYGSPEELVERVHTLDGELQKFSEILSAKPQVVVLNKVDIRPDLPDIAKEVGRLLDRPVTSISGVSGEGLRRLADGLLQLLADQAENAG